MNELIQIDLTGLTVFVNTEEQLASGGQKESYFFWSHRCLPQLDAKSPLDINDNKSGLIENRITVMKKGVCLNEKFFTKRLFVKDSIFLLTTLYLVL